MIDSSDKGVNLAQSSGLWR